ncbi:hypothetical protein B0O99DRAFT_695042 [Bisporella sp. PMI_857]|nr:hypothetical protein B0O99DRAFT_695042 [Bisporella sp. PMI_857]
MSIKLPTGPIADNIHTGFWINRSFSAFRGATLTLDQQTGALLIAFLALFIGAAGRSLWKIICFVLYLAFSRIAAQDGVYHQRQAILRNTSLAHNTALALLQTSFVWRKRTQMVHRRLLPVALLAAIISVASVALGVLSSRVSINTTNEALIAGKECGALPLSDPIFSDFERYSIYSNQLAIKAFTHAIQCYIEVQSKLPESCNKFVIPALPYTLDGNASCPFAAELCKSSTGNLLLSSGDLDSFNHLGFNINPRFVLRHQTHCAPLETINFTEIITAQNSSKRFLTYKYGSSEDQPFVYQFELDKKRPTGSLTSDGDYKITYGGDSDYQFISQFNQSQGTVTLSFLDASDILTANETYDPWFSGTTLVKDTSLSGALSFYKAAGVLGCVTQQFFCNLSLPQATRCIDIFAGNTTYALSKTWSDAQDQSIIRPILATLETGVLEQMYSLRGVPSLLSRKTIVGNFQSLAIPNNMWQLERAYLYVVNLAFLQHAAVEYARGLWTGEANDYCGVDNECQRICYSQKVRSEKHFSFSVWILIFILLMGSTVVFLATFIEQVFAFICLLPLLRSSQKLAYSHAEWQASSALQLQRLVHENLGLGNWSRTDKSVPVTEMGDLLGVLDISDAKHTRMTQPRVEMFDIDVAKRNMGVEARACYSKVSSTELI